MPWGLGPFATWRPWLRRPAGGLESAKARAEAVRRLKNAEQQYAGAIKAQKEGKVALAATLYLRVAVAHPKNRHSGQAKQALAAMANEGRAQLEKAEKLLESGDVATAFKQLDHLAREYEHVPRFNHEVAERVQKLHADPKYKAEINEPRAAALVDEAQRCEAADEICCAFIAYEEAAKLLPAPSAKRAEERWTAMKRDPKIVAEAETCLNVRECLRMFHTAELLAKSSPGLAAEMFRKILARSPADSEVHRCATRSWPSCTGTENRPRSRNCPSSQHVDDVFRTDAKPQRRAGNDDVACDRQAHAQPASSP